MTDDRRSRSWGWATWAGPMSTNLVAAGHTVRGFDPVPRGAAAAAEATASRCSTAAPRRSPRPTS